MQEKVNKACIFADYGRCDALSQVEFGCRHSMCPFFKTEEQEKQDQRVGYIRADKYDFTYKTRQQISENDIQGRWGKILPVSLVKGGKVYEMWESLTSLCNWYMVSKQQLMTGGGERVFGRDVVVKYADRIEYIEWVERLREDG